MGLAVNNTWTPRVFNPPETSQPPRVDTGSSTTTSGSAAPSQFNVTGASPQITTQPVVQVQSTPPGSLLPANFADDVKTNAPPKIEGMEADDPRLSLIEQGYDIQDIDSDVTALMDRPVDVEGAKLQVQTATGNEQQFWTGVFGRLNKSQSRELESLANAAAAAPEDAAAQTAFDQAVMPLLSADQRTQLRTLQRASQDAQLNLEGQTAAKKLVDAKQSGSADKISLATADARVYVSTVRQVSANRKAQDAQLLVMTPENQQKLAGPQKTLLAASEQARLNPGDETAKQNLTNAQKAFDEALTATLSASDKKTIDTIEAAAARERNIGSILVDEANAERQYFTLTSAEQQRGGQLNETERRILDLAKGDYEFVKKSRDMRNQAVQAGAAGGDDAAEQLQKLDGVMVEVLKMKGDLEVKHAEFNRDVVSQGVNPPQNTQKTSAGDVVPVAYTTGGPGKGQTLTVADAFKVGMPSADLTVDQASKQVDAAKQSRSELEEMLKPPPQPKRSGWDHALDIIAGVGEIIGGVALMAFAGWTGIGAVAGGAIVVDGLFRLGHSISDAANGTTTDTMQSKLFQSLGASQETANRIDAGVSLLATVPVGVGGAAITALRASSIALKSVNVVGGLTVLDGAQAQARYMATGDAVNPMMVDGLISLGLTPTQANYALVGGNLIATGGAVAAARKGPSTGARPATTPTDEVSPQIPKTELTSTSPESTIYPIDLLRSRSNTDVAILGGGNVGFTLSADLVSNTGMKPTLLFRGDGTRADRISPVTGNYRFNETLHGGTNFLDLSADNFGYMDTTAGLQAMRDAKTLVVTLPDAPQTRLALFERLQRDELVNDPSKTVVLIRGGQAGQPALSQIIRDNPNWRANVVLVEDSPYGTRVQHNQGTGEDPHVINGKRKDDVEVSVLAEQGDPTRGLGAMTEMFPLGQQLGKGTLSWPDFNVVPGVAMPWRAGYFIHPGVAFDAVNLAKTQAGQKYLHYAEGVHPELGDKLFAINLEEVALARTYGVNAETFPQKLERQFGLPLQDEPFHVTMGRTRDIYKSTSYGSIEDLMKSRYPQEDAAAVPTMLWLGERAGAPMPVHSAYFNELVTTFRQLGMSEHELTHHLQGYVPILNSIEGGVPEITQLLNEPHVRPQ